MAMMHWMRAAVMLAMLVGCLAAESTAASAAVRVCEVFVDGQGTAPTQRLARKRALGDWMRLARAFGPGYTAWRLADSKGVSCRKSADGSHACHVRAKPCRIRQVPPPVNPQGRPQRQPQSQSIET